MKRSTGWRAAIVALAVPVVVLAGYPASASSASWSISGCRLDKSSSPVLYADVAIKNLDPNTEHYYNIDVQFDYGTHNRLGKNTTWTDWIRPLEQGKAKIILSDPSASAAGVREGTVDCKVTKVTDENNSLVTQKK